MVHTCGLCGTELKENYCSYCKMKLEKEYISKNGKRLGHYENFKHLPAEHLVHSSTKELMELSTIDLLCLLRVARKDRAFIYNLRKLRHDAEKEKGLTDDVIEIDKMTYEEYENATRKVWVIENIIKSRIGYFPLRVTDNFISMFLERMQKSEMKDMVIKK